MKISIFGRLLLVGVAALIIAACNSKKQAIVQEVEKKELTEAEIRRLPKLLTYAKSPCFGRCPHFTMTVYEDGWTIFEGKRFTLKKGMAILQLRQGQLDTLVAQCDKADIWSAEASYGMRIQDLPTTTIHLFETNRDKSVQWRMDQPQKLQQLDSHLMEMVTQSGWVAPVERKQRKDSTREEMRIEDELIIQLRDEIDGATWVESYKEYGMHLKKPISKLANMYLFKFDTKRINPQELFDKVQADKKVARVEFNKKLQSRTR